VNTIPEKTLKAFADHGKIGAAMPADGGDADAELARFAAAKVDVAALAKQLQDDGAKAFVKSWKDLLGMIDSKSAALERAS
jgi:transaldolase